MDGVVHPPESDKEGDVFGSDRQEELLEPADVTEVVRTKAQARLQTQQGISKIGFFKHITM